MFVVSGLNWFWNFGFVFWLSWWFDFVVLGLFVFVAYGIVVALYIGFVWLV